MPPNLSDPPVIILLSVLITTIVVMFKMLTGYIRKIEDHYRERISDLQDRLKLEEEENKRWQSSASVLLENQREQLTAMKELLARRGK